MLLSDIINSIDTDLLQDVAYDFVDNFRNNNVQDGTALNQLDEIGRKIDVLKNLKVGEAHSFLLKYRNFEYPNDNVENMLIANKGLSPQYARKASEVLKEVLKAGATEIDNVSDLLIGQERKELKALTKFDAMFKQQTGFNIQELVNFIFQNGKGTIKKHVILGTKSNTGKSVIIELLGVLFAEFSIMKSQRPQNDFDIINWNADVIDSFVVLIDDDDPENQISQDFIKNFLNTSQPLQLGRSQKRWSQKFYGNTVIALNNEPDFIGQYENNKRILFLKMTENLDDYFNENEIANLHDVSLENIMALFYKQETTPVKELIANHINRWDKTEALEKEQSDLEHEIEQVKKFVDSYDFVQNKDLIKMFNKKAIKLALGGADTMTVNGKTFYGYSTKQEQAVIKQSDDIMFSVTYFQNRTETKPIEAVADFERFINYAVSFQNTPKEQQPQFSFSDSAREDEITKTTGVVIDIDNSKYKTLDEVPIENIEYNLMLVETTSSYTEDNGLRYRIIIPNLEKLNSNADYKNVCNLVAVSIDENLDSQGNSRSHRFYVGAKNYRIQDSKKHHLAEYMEELDFEPLKDFVEHATKGERNSSLFWALKRAEEQNASKDDIIEIIENSSLPSDEKNNFKRRFAS